MIKYTMIPMASYAMILLWAVVFGDIIGEDKNILLEEYLIICAISCILCVIYDIIKRFRNEKTN